MRTIIFVASACAFLAGCEERPKEMKLPSGTWNCSSGVLDRGDEPVREFVLKIEGERFSFPDGDPTYKQKSVTRKNGEEPPHSGVLQIGPSRDFDKNISPPGGSRTHIILMDKEAPTQSQWYYVEYNGARPAEIFYLDKAILKDPPPYDGLIRSARCKLG